MIKNRPLLDPTSSIVVSEKKSNKKQRSLKKPKTTYDAEEENLLENIVFGDRIDILNQIDKNVDLVTVDTTGDGNDELQNQFFVFDRSGDQNISELDNEDNNGVFEEQAVNDALDDISDDELRELLKSKSNENNQNNKTAPITDQKPAWEDEDDQIKADEGFDGCRKLPKLVKSDDQYKEYLERKFTTIYETPSWATKALEKKNKTKPKRRQYSDTESDEDEYDDDDDYLIDRTARDFKRSKQRKDKTLDKDFLHIKKCSHLNQTSRVRTSLNCINFHQKATVALLGSPVGLVRLFQVDGKVNSIIQSIYFRGYRLCDAKFLSLAGREEIIVGSDGSNPKSIGYCYYYDMIAGKIVRVKLEKASKIRYSLRGFEVSPDGQYLAACDNNGYINILSSASKEHISELKMNGEVDCLAFSSDSNYLVAHGKENGCQAYVWDIRNIRSSINCINRFNDLGTVEATSVAISQTGSLAAIGSNMGVVNLYKFDDLLKKTDPEPIRSVMNLTTAVTSLRFNHDGQLLLMASEHKNDSIRFLNTNSNKVYQNFPLFVGPNNRTYGRIYDVDISPNSGFFALATGNGTGHLFRINEYSSY